MEEILSKHELRVLGCLMEKQLTTPDYYPLTLKSLTAACNQKSSRVPVMDLSASEGGGVIHDLRGRGLVTAIMDGRVDRFEQQLSRKLKLTSKDRAVLSVLMLRAGLTLNEIRIHTGRMVTFESSEALQEVLIALMSRDDPLLQQLPRATGQREVRFVHLLGGELDVVMAQQGDVVDGADDGSDDVLDRVAQLEKGLADLYAKIAHLSAFTGFDSQ